MKRRGIRITTTVMSVTDSALVTVTRMDDHLHRLTSATYSTGESYAYAGCRSGSDDAVGNRVAMTDTTGTTTYTYDAANRLTSIELPDSSVQTYTWDARGNLLNTGTFTYTYDAAGRMVRAQSVDLTSVYTYTADGLRVQQAVDGTVTSFAWDWALPLAQVMATSDGVLSLYGLGHLGETQSGDWAYPLVDALDSVRQWSDGAGAITYAAGYTPFGEALWHAGSTASSWGYAGEWYDPHAELLYLRARWYAVHTGRFTTQDPWGGNHQQPGTLNPYVYALNNPVLLTDPSGEWCIAGFDVGPGRGCTDQERQQWAGVWERAGGLVSSPDFAEGFLLEFLDSVLAGGISLPATTIEYWLNRTQSYPVQQFLYSLMMLRCGNNAESYAALKTPYSYLFNRPDPRFQLGRAVGRVTALGLALGEISISVSGGVASAVAAGTGVGVPFAVGGATLSIEVGAHAVAVIGAVVVKEAADHLVLSAVTGNLPGGGSSGGPTSGPGGGSAAGPGQWQNVNENMSPRARAYQEQITGRSGQAYVVDGTKYDGYTNGVLLEAKGPGYDGFLRSDGSWKPWYEGRQKLLEQAESQLRKAKPLGYHVEWHVAEEASANAMRRLLEDAGYGAITVIWTPALP